MQSRFGTSWFSLRGCTGTGMQPSFPVSFVRKKGPKRGMDMDAHPTSIFPISAVNATAGAPGRFQPAPSRSATVPGRCRVLVRLWQSGVFGLAPTHGCRCTTTVGP